jgi:succinate dehydrogenase flavin-adding protein (antitoxin of CptAB toxin-antitoxin module)
MRELDVLLMRYVDQEYSGASAEHQAAFETLLYMQDPGILDLLTQRVVPEDQSIRDVVQRILTHH